MKNWEQPSSHKQKRTFDNKGLRTVVGPYARKAYDNDKLGTAIVPHPKRELRQWKIDNIRRTSDRKNIRQWRSDKNRTPTRKKRITIKNWEQPSRKKHTTIKNWERQSTPIQKETYDNEELRTAIGPRFERKTWQWRIENSHRASIRKKHTTMKNWVQPSCLTQKENYDNEELKTAIKPHPERNTWQ